MTGRPSKVHKWLMPENIVRIKGWAMDGLIDDDIAERMEISRSTLSEWKKKYPQISDALKEGKDSVDRQVERSLLQRALGYEYEEVKRVKVKKGKTSTEERIEKVTKVVPPDVTAQIFWLKNRKQNEWRDKREQVISTVEDLTPLADLLNAEDADD